MEEIANWIAPAATMIAAMMTAANLGTRVTGWGFVVFTIGSICWSIIGITSGQPNLLLSNGFLTIVNIVGIWRWLGRQAKYEDGGKSAAVKSMHKPVPALFQLGSIAGAPLLNAEGRKIAIVVDAMMRCGDHSLAYVVLSQGGVGGVGETLRVADPKLLRFREDGITSDLDEAGITSLPEIALDNWPEELPAKDASRAA